MYRTLAIIPPDAVDPLSLAEQCRQLSDAARKRIEEEKRRALIDPTIDKKAKKLYAKVIRDIKKESDRGNHSLFWANSDEFFFKWTVSLPMAVAICNLLTKNGFSCSEAEAASDPGQYYIS